MSMEIRDEAMVRSAAAANNNSSSSANSECSHPVVKGKRTKRQRVHQSPATAAAASSTSSSSGDLSGTATEEDEDMANCLILLAQGRTEQQAAGTKLEATALQKDGSDGGERFTSRRLAEAVTTDGKPGFYVYECKTCNKCFPSFQALGGHRSSHKKLKMAPAETDATTEEKAAAVEEDNTQVNVRVSNPTILSGNNTTTIGAAATVALTSSTNNNNNGSNNNTINNKNNSGVSNLNKPRVHECSICGSEFSSGQALGGHMRRHRPAAAVEAKKEKSILSLDLNLPAPAEDDRGDYLKSPSFPFPGGQPLLFSPSALVDCHY